MAFACWYSIHKNLPDAKVAVIYNRLHAEWDAFKWTNPCGVELLAYSDKNGVLPKIEVFKNVDITKTVSPNTMAVRTYDETNLGPVDVSSEMATTFVTYEERCGQFITSEWINSVGHPFRNAFKRFGKNDPTVNEQKVFELWEKAGLLFIF